MVIRVALAALATVGIAGCTLVYAPSNREAPAIGASDYCLELARFGCQEYNDCCMPIADFDMCVSGAATACSREFGPFLTDPRTGYDPARAGQHLAQGRVIAAACSPDIIDWYADLETIFAGTVPGGGNCTPRNDMDIPALLSCIDDDQACLPRTPSEWICADRGASGSECRINADCQDGLYCRRATDLLPGHCEATLGNGSACDEASDCATRLCSSNQCVPRDPHLVYCGAAGMI